MGSNENKRFSNYLGTQSPQERLSLVGPSQFSSPYLGGRESHSLILYCTPPPHDTLQIEYLVQFPNTLFTGHSVIERVSVLLPTQFAPPFAGTGLLHFLMRF